MPTYHRHPLRSRPIMAAALAVNDLIAWDRNAGLSDPDRHVPTGRLLSRAECLRLAPDVPADGLTGAALWYDGQLHDSERLTLAFVRSAAELGADAANHLRAVELLREGDRITGVKAVDRFTQRVLTIRARMVLNTAGPWIERLLDGFNGHRLRPLSRWLKVVNLVLDVPMPQGVALALPMRTPNSHVPGLLFLTPWQGRTIVGSTSTTYEGTPEACQVTEEEIQAFVDGINAAHPGWHLTRRDVARVHMGLLPAAPTGHGAPTATVRRQYAIVDHARVHGVEGLITVLGVKYTTARDVSEKAVAAVCRKLRHAGLRFRSRTTPVHGGQIASLRALLDEALRDRPWDLNAAVIHHLVHSYGSAYGDVVRLIRENLIWAEPVTPARPVIKAEIIYAIRYEMAATLSDVIFRRTGLGAGGSPGSQAIDVCAEVMAAELEWDEVLRQQEIDEVRHLFARVGARREAEDVTAATMRERVAV